jgi:hypothetical protein
MIGIVAAVAATAGDLLLLATTNASRPGFEWLPAASEPMLVAGTYLGVLAIPCYALGYRTAAARVAGRFRRALVALGAIGGVLGGTIHGLTGLVIHFELASATAAVDPITVIARHGAYLLPLWAVVGAAAIAASLLWTVAVLSEGSTLPRWMAVVNPAMLTILIATATRGSLLGDAFAIPAAPNLAHVIFFTAVATMPERR